MSDPQRNAIEEIGLNEQEAFHLVEETMNALGHQYIRTRVSKDSLVGFSWENRTPSSALRAITDMIQDRTGCTEPEAMEMAVDELKELRDCALENGTDAGLKRIRHEGDLSQSISKLNRWLADGSKVDQVPDFGLSETMTIFDSARDDLVERAYNKHLVKEHQAFKDLVNGSTKNVQDVFKTRMELDYQKLKAQNDENIKETEFVQKSLSIQVNAVKASKGLQDRREQLSNRVDRAVAKGEQAHKSRSHQARFRNFWKSEEGQKRKDEIIKQGAMMSLGARRISGMTTRQEPTQLDFRAAEKSFERELKLGKFSRASGITAIHQAGKHGMIDHLKKQRQQQPKDQRLTNEEIADIVKKGPRVNEIYRELTGKKITAKEADKLLLRDADRIAKQQLRPEDTKAAEQIHEDLSEAFDKSRSDVEQGKGLDFDPEKNPGLVRREDTERAQSTNQSFNRFEYVKTERPLNKDLEDQQKPEKQAVTEQLKEKKIEADKSYRHVDRVNKRALERENALKEKIDQPLDEEAEKRKQQREERQRQHQIRESRDRDDEGPKR